MSSSAKIIATNTIVMYIRMLFLIVISFITSRYLLKILGIEDFGIYSVVGSVSATFVSLKSLFSESIQRYLNYEKGKESLERQQMIYSISVVIHVLLALLFVVIVEVVGIWLIMNKLVIPVEKMDTALFVFHMSVAALVFGILSIPYDALVIANERMTFYAFVSIFDGLLKLIVILMIPTFPFEYLKTYAVLIAVIPLITLLFLFSFSKKNFKECCFIKIRDNGLVKGIFSLSGWNFFGNISFSLLHEGINFLLNTYGGLVMNAARAVSYQIKNVAVQFSNNTLVAVRPTIMQSAAINSKQELSKKIFFISKLSFYGILLFVVPIIVYCEKLLSVWLVEVPENSGLFTQLVLTAVTVRSLHEPLNIMYMSVGKLKNMMIIETIIMLGTFLGAYIILKSGASIYSVFIMLIIMEIVIVLALSANAEKELHISAKLYYIEVLLPLVKLLLVIIPLVFLGIMYLQTELLSLTLFFCVIYVLITLSAIYINMSKKERELIHNLIKR